MIHGGIKSRPAVGQTCVSAAFFHLERNQGCRSAGHFTRQPTRCFAALSQKAAGWYPAYGGKL